jgi:hypothetical protein
MWKLSHSAINIVPTYFNIYPTFYISIPQNHSKSKLCDCYARPGVTGGAGPAN